MKYNIKVVNTVAAGVWPRAEVVGSFMDKDVTETALLKKEWEARGFNVVVTEAQPEQEPVAWVNQTGDVLSNYWKQNGGASSKEYSIPLYASPLIQPKQEPIAWIYHLVYKNNQIGQRCINFTKPIRDYINLYPLYTSPPTDVEYVANNGIELC